MHLLDVVWFSSTNKKCLSFKLLVRKIWWKTSNFRYVILQGFKVNSPLKTSCTFYKVGEKEWPQECVLYPTIRKYFKEWILIRICHAVWATFQVNPLTPKCDKHKISPYNKHPLSSKQVKRILRLIRRIFYLYITPNSCN